MSVRLERIQCRPSSTCKVMVKAIYRGRRAARKRSASGVICCTSRRVQLGHATNVRFLFSLWKAGKHLKNAGPQRLYVEEKMARPKRFELLAF